MRFVLLSILIWIPILLASNVLMFDLNNRADDLAEMVANARFNSQKVDLSNSTTAASFFEIKKSDLVLYHTDDFSRKKIDPSLSTERIVVKVFNPEPIDFRGLKSFIDKNQLQNVTEVSFHVPSELLDSAISGINEFGYLIDSDKTAIGICIESSDSISTNLCRAYYYYHASSR